MPPTSSSTLFTPSDVRLRKRTEKPGRLNWLMLPGGPGIGSDSLFELADSLNVSGKVWMVDLPGDGNNLRPELSDPYLKWPGVLIEAAKALAPCVYVGHSTGGMYLLDTPELESCIEALVLISSAPDSSWQQKFAEMTRANPLPAVEITTAEYVRDKTNQNLRAIAMASAEWNFTPPAVALGREFLSRPPYNFSAVEWSDKNFDTTYSARWWPKSLPTLILSGEKDRIVDQSLWLNPRFQGSHVLHRIIPDSAHFPWLEKPSEVSAAFDELCAAIQRH